MKLQAYTSVGKAIAAAQKIANRIGKPVPIILSPSWEAPTLKLRRPTESMRQVVGRRLRNPETGAEFIERLKAAGWSDPSSYALPVSQQTAARGAPAGLGFLQIQDASSARGRKGRRAPKQASLFHDDPLFRKRNPPTPARDRILERRLLHAMKDRPGIVLGDVVRRGWWQAFKRRGYTGRDLARLLGAMHKKGSIVQDRAGITWRLAKINPARRRRYPHGLASKFIRQEMRAEKRKPRGKRRKSRQLIAIAISRARRAVVRKAVASRRRRRRRQHC